MCVRYDFSDRNKCSQTGDNGRLESIAQVTTDILRNRQYQNDIQSSNFYAIRNTYEFHMQHIFKTI